MYKITVQEENKEENNYGCDGRDTESIIQETINTDKEIDMLESCDVGHTNVSILPYYVNTYITNMCNSLYEAFCVH